MAVMSLYTILQRFHIAYLQKINLNMRPDIIDEGAYNLYLYFNFREKPYYTMVGQCDVAKIPSLLNNETITALQSLFVFSVFIQGGGGLDENKGGQRLWQRSA